MQMSARTKTILVAGLATAALLMADAAFAGGAGSSSLQFNANGKTIGQVTGNITTSLRGFGPLIMIICYIGALVFGLIGAMKWKEHAEQPDRTAFKIPVMYWGIAVLLAGFPEFMGTGITTLWGTGGQVVTEP